MAHLSRVGNVSVTTVTPEGILPPFRRPGCLSPVKGVHSVTASPPTKSPLPLPLTKGGNRCTLLAALLFFHMDPPTSAMPPAAVFLPGLPLWPVSAAVVCSLGGRNMFRWRRDTSFSGVCLRLELDTARQTCGESAVRWLTILYIYMCVIDHSGVA